jgi:alkylhydroperoxidase/carboxymuconolactone decarboxylase family protein YurZ
MADDPLKIYEDLDPDLRKLVKEISEFALSDGALPKKYKLLIAMALDAAHGAEKGVRALVQLALNAGATKEEVAETIRVVHYVSGVGGVYIAAHALEKVL